MGYFYECDYCDACVPMLYGDDDLSRTCELCGQDGCIQCMASGVCHLCQEDEMLAREVDMPPLGDPDPDDPNW